jgi:hypothetical protein
VLASPPSHIQLRVKTFNPRRSEENMKHIMLKLAAGVMIGVAASTAALGQYGGGGMGGSVGGGAKGGVYTPPKGGYSSSTGIALGAGAAAGITAGYLVLRSHHSMVGCVGETAKGTTLANGKGVYTLDTGDVNLKVGDRVKVRGKKTKTDSGEPSFAVKKLVKDYGSCTTAADLKPTQP